MANEITATSTLRVSNGSLVYNSPQRSNAITMSGDHYSAVGQTIGVTEEALSINADVATLGVAEFTNLDAVNSISIGVKPASTFYPLIMLKPGESYVVRIDPAATLYAIASATSGAILDHKIFED